MRSATAAARYNAAGSKLKIINDAREEAARQKRMANPRYERLLNILLKQLKRRLKMMRRLKLRNKLFKKILDQE